jgi:uncharacterized protein involved in outer membrane biogenesis
MEFNMIKRLFRYTLLAISLLIVLWLIGILVIYFTVDVKQVKHTIIEQVEKNTKATLNIDDIKLRVFPVVHFELSNIKLLSTKRFNKSKVFSCKKTKLNFNLLSLIVGQPKISFLIKSPSIFIKEKYQTNSLNDVILKKNEKQTSESSKDSLGMIKYIFVSKFIFNIENAKFEYFSKGQETKFDNINVSLEIDPMKRKAILSLNSYKDIDLNAQLTMIKDKLFSISANAKVNMIKDLPIQLSALINTDLTDLEVKNIDISIYEKWLNIKGRVNNFLEDNLNIDLKISSKPLKLENFENILGVKSDANFKLSGLVKGNLNPLPIVKLKANLVEKNKINLISKIDFSKNLNINIDASKLDLTKYKKLLMPESSNKSGNKKISQSEESKSLSKSSKPNTKNMQNDELYKRQDLVMLKKSIKDMSIKANIKLYDIILDDIKIKSIISSLFLNKNYLSIKNLNMKAFNGAIKSNANINFNLNKPTYKGNFDIEKINLQTAVDSASKNLKGSTKGLISSKLNFSSNGYKLSTIKKNLLAKGDFSINNMEYNLATLNDMLKENLKDVSFVKDKVKIPSKSKGWKIVSGDYNIKDEKILINKFNAKDGNYNIDGSGYISFDEYIDVIFNFTMPFSAIPYEALRVSPKSSMLPIHLVGPLIKPRLDFPYTVKYISKKSLEYEKSKLKKKITNQVKPKLEKKAKQELKKAGKKLKNMFKGFKF